MTDHALLVIGRVTALTLALSGLLLSVWFAGWLSIYVVERYCSYIGVHREILYFIRNRKALRSIIHKRQERRGVLGGLVTRRSMRWGRK